MTFGLGVDLGTTFTAAAVSRSGRPEMVNLGERSPAIPSVVMIREDGTSIVGDAAHRRAASHPARVAREVKRRLGDPTPLILGGEPHSAAQILSRLLRAAVDAAVAREGRRPDGIVLTHPANWGPYKRELFDSVPRLADLTAVSMVTEPEAAAAHYASTARVAEGSVVAVYDLGGGTFDATVLRQLDDGFEFLGPPEGIEGLGGIDFDEAVFAHVDRSLDGALSELDLDDPRAAASLVRVRQDCVLAKEALSGDTETSVPVMLPDLHTEVRLTRGEFEEMVRGPIEATVSALRRALTAADVAPEDLSNVLLVGGSSRIPLVSQMLSAELGRPTAVDTHPKHAVALGAALLTGRRRVAAPRPGTPARGIPVSRPSGRPADRRPGASGPTPAPPAERPPGRGPKTPAVEPAALANSATVVSKAGIGPPKARATGSSGRVPVVGPRSGGPASGAPSSGGPSSGGPSSKGPSSGGPSSKGPSSGGPSSGGPSSPGRASRASPSGGPPPAGPPSGTPRGMRPPSGSMPVAPPSAPFRAVPPSAGTPPRNGGDRRPPGRDEGPVSSAAGTAPPPLGQSSAAEVAETRRRRIRIGVICGAVALVLGGGGVATAAALTGHTPGASVAPPAPAVSSVTTTPPPAAPSPAPVAQAHQQPASNGGSQHTTTHHPPTTSRKSDSGSDDPGSGGGY